MKASRLFRTGGCEPGRRSQILSSSEVVHSQKGAGQEEKRGAQVSNLPAYLLVELSTSLGPRSLGIVCLFARVSVYPMNVLHHF